MPIRIAPMTADDWSAVRRIHAEGIATGDATLEREPPDWAHFDHSHPAECRLIARDRPGGPIVGWTALGHYSARRVYGGVPGRASTSRKTLVAGGSGGRCSQALIPASEAAGYWTLLAGVLIDNAASLALHEAVGFRRVGVQVRMGQDPSGRWRDIVLLERRSDVVGS